MDALVEHVEHQRLIMDVGTRRYKSDVLLTVPFQYAYGLFVLFGFTALLLNQIFKWRQSQSW